MAAPRRSAKDFDTEGRPLTTFETAILGALFIPVREGGKRVGKRMRVR
jgi:hypothetical protein